MAATGPAPPAIRLVEAAATAPEESKRKVTDKSSGAAMRPLFVFQTFGPYLLKTRPPAAKYRRTDLPI